KGALPRSGRENVRADHRHLSTINSAPVNDAHQIDSGQTCSMKAASLEIEHEHGGSAPSLTSTQVETVLAPRVRYIGVDLARFLAVVGMIAAHVLAVNAMSSAVGPFERFVSGVAD